jgi:3-oxoadipate enol-lactonase
VKYHVKREGLKNADFDLSLARPLSGHGRAVASSIKQGATRMDRLFVNGTVNAAQSGPGSGKAPPLFLFHSLLSDRASFDAIAPELSRSHRVIIPELPGFGGSKAVSGGLADVADRMAEAVSEAGAKDTIVLGNGYGGFVALQMAIRHPDIASKLVLADCGAAFSEAGREAFRTMAAVSKAKGLAAITDVAMRRLFAPEFQAAHPDLMAGRREAFLKTDPEVLQAACAQLAELDLRPELSKVKMPVLVLVGEHDEATPPPMSHELAALLPNARLKILSGCAHVPQLQEPQAFLDAIADFLTDAHATA